MATMKCEICADLMQISIEKYGEFVKAICISCAVAIGVDWVRCDDCGAEYINDSKMTNCEGCMKQPTALECVKEFEDILEGTNV